MKKTITPKEKRGSWTLLLMKKCQIVVKNVILNSWGLNLVTKFREDGNKCFLLRPGLPGVPDGVVSKVECRPLIGTKSGPEDLGASYVDGRRNNGVQRRPGSFPGVERLIH